MKISGIIVAAGKGSRFGFKKQFATINGRWVLDYSVDVLKEFCDEIVVVAAKEDIEKISKKYDFVIAAEGGRERMFSVYNGLLRVSCDIVMIHDAARPVLDKKLVKKLIETAKSHGSAVPVIMASDTIKKVEGDVIVKTIDRSGLYFAQTPQVFDYDKLKLAYDEAIKNSKNYTDESSVWEEFYGSAYCIDGIRKNLKITFKDDLEILKCLLG